MDNTIGIIGNGSWATALAKILTDNGSVVHWWMRDEAAAHTLRTQHRNPLYLPAVAFPPGSIIPTTDLHAVVAATDVLVVAVPSAFIAEVLAPLNRSALKDKVILSAIKGIVGQENTLLNDFLLRHFEHPTENYVAITGPCHAEEIAQERLSYLTFSGLDRQTTTACAAYFTNAYLRSNCNGDLWGVQYAAVLKNIYAIGAGIAHGLGYGDNFLSVYLTNCYREMHYFLRAQFEKMHTASELPDFHTSAYLGDLLVTAYSPHSRNRSFGTLLGKGYSPKEASIEMNMIAEGYYASRSMAAIIATLQLDMPLAHAVYEVLWEEQGAKSVFKNTEALLS